MKFSFKQTKERSKTMNVFQSTLQPQKSKEEKPSMNEQKEEKKRMNVDEEENKLNTNNNTNLSDDPCTIFTEQYEIAISNAENGIFVESLRAFDIAIRFWAVYLEKLKEIYPLQYKKLKFPDINTCDTSNYFLNLYEKNKDKKNKKIKKKLWKPPPKHQPNQQNDNNDDDNNNNDDDDDEIIYFDDADCNDDDDDDDDVDLIEDEQKMDKKSNNDISEWKKLILNHRKIGSEMFEYHAQVLLEMNRDFEAIKACQSAILLNDLNGINWLTLSRSELNYGDPYQSLKSISRAIQLDFENDEIIQHYSNVYTICNKLDEMKKTGKITDDVLKRRFSNNCQCKTDIKLIKQRLEKRGNTNDHIGRMDDKTDTQHIVENYQKMIKMTKGLSIDKK